MDVAYAVLVEVGEGKRLKMVKARLPEIVAYAAFNARTGKGRDEVGYYLYGKGGKIKSYKPGQRVDNAGDNVIVDGVALKKRYHNVHSTADHAEQRHSEQLVTVGLYEGDHFSDAEPGQADKVFAFFLFIIAGILFDFAGAHASASSPSGSDI